MKFSACITTIIATLATSVQCHSWVSLFLHLHQYCMILTYFTGPKS